MTNLNEIIFSLRKENNELAENLMKEVAELQKELKK